MNQVYGRADSGLEGANRRQFAAERAATLKEPI